MKVKSNSKSNKNKSYKNKNCNTRSNGSIASIGSIDSIDLINTNNEVKNYQKKKIPKKVKEEVWVSNFGYRYNSKCYINWCSNKINVFNFHVGHDVPESKGGSDNINNLKPICDRCNLSMGSQNTIQEWNKKYTKKRNCYCFTFLTSLIKLSVISSAFYFNNQIYELYNNYTSYVF